MSIKLKGSSDGSVSFDAPADTSPSGSDITLTLPTSAGSANQFLKNSGTAGTLEYSSMVEDSSGNVGIGKTSSGNKLEIEDQGDTKVVIDARTDAANGSLSSLELWSKNGSGTNNFGQIEYDGDGNFIIGSGGSGGGGVPIVFRHGNTERARIDTLGNVGIGTTSIASGGANTTNFNVHTPSANSVFLKLSNSSTGNTSSDAFDLSADSSGNAYLINRENANMTFWTNATERLRIGDAGDTTFRGDEYGLGVRSAASSSSVITAYFGAHSSTSMSTGSVTFEVYTNGNVKNSNNSYGQISDERLKENIVNAPSQWDDIKSLQIRKYNFRDGNGYDTHTQIGLVAQEVEAVSPGLVQETPVREDATPVLDAEGNELEATKSVITSVLYMKAVKALQEAQTRIETLETQNTAQQTQIDDLLARVTALEAA